MCEISTTSALMNLFFTLKGFINELLDSHAKLKWDMIQKLFEKGKSEY